MITYFEKIGAKFAIMATIFAKIIIENKEYFTKLFSQWLIKKYLPIGQLRISTVEKIKKKKILIIVRGSISSKFNEKSMKL